jgi:hypothetical protein
MESSPTYGTACTTWTPAPRTGPPSSRPPPPTRRSPRASTGSAPSPPATRSSSSPAAPNTSAAPPSSGSTSTASAAIGSSCVAKAEELRRLGRGRDVVLVLDDDPDVCAALRSDGWPVEQATWVPHAKTLRDAQEREGRT